VPQKTVNLQLYDMPSYTVGTRYIIFLATKTVDS